MLFVVLYLLYAARCSLHVCDFNHDLVEAVDGGGDGLFGERVLLYVAYVFTLSWFTWLNLVTEAVRAWIRLCCSSRCTKLFRPKGRQRRRGVSNLQKCCQSCGGVSKAAEVC